MLGISSQPKTEAMPFRVRVKAILNLITHLLSGPRPAASSLQRTATNAKSSGHHLTYTPALHISETWESLSNTSFSSRRQLDYGKTWILLSCARPRMFQRGCTVALLATDTSSVYRTTTRRRKNRKSKRRREKIRDERCQELENEQKYERDVIRDHLTQQKRFVAHCPQQLPIHSPSLISSS